MHLSKYCPTYIPPHWLRRGIWTHFDRWACPWLGGFTHHKYDATALAQRHAIPILACGSIKKRRGFDQVVCPRGQSIGISSGQIPTYCLHAGGVVGGATHWLVHNSLILLQMAIVYACTQSGDLKPHKYCTRGSSSLHAYNQVTWNLTNTVHVAVVVCMHIIRWLETSQILYTWQ